MPEERKKTTKSSVFRTPAPPAIACENEVALGPSAPPIIASDALLGGRTEVQIRHRGEIYRLTLTRTGKLILHK
jgi:hemin uptake protein HemP